MISETGRPQGNPYEKRTPHDGNTAELRGGTPVASEHARSTQRTSGSVVPGTPAVAREGSILSPELKAKVDTYREILAKRAAGEIPDPVSHSARRPENVALEDAMLPLLRQGYTQEKIQALLGLGESKYLNTVRALRAEGQVGYRNLEMRKRALGQREARERARPVRPTEESTTSSPIAQGQDSPPNEEVRRWPTIGDEIRRGREESKKDDR
jgi:hypothetical protein